MEVKVVGSGGAAMAHVSLAPGETCTAEAGAMVAFDPGLRIETTTHQRGQGSLLRAARRVLAGESFFLNHYTARDRPGDLMLAPALAGGVVVRALKGERLIIQAGSFLAKGEGVTIDMGWQGVKSLLAGESLFWLHGSGHGPLVLSSFGALYPVEVDGSHVVDTGHIVAFDETLDFSLTKPGRSWVGAFLGGEGLVCRFRGKGTVWCQSHNPRGFGANLRPFLKHRSA